VVVCRSWSFGGDNGRKVETVVVCRRMWSHGGYSGSKLETVVVCRRERSQGGDCKHSVLIEIITVNTDINLKVRAQ
jgi:hypothetical protein